MSDHVAPSHRSTSVCVKAPTTDEPTARQLVAVAHETADNSLVVAPGIVGSAATDQVEPFHCSTNFCGVSKSVTEPTAKQLVLAGHEMLDRRLETGSSGRLALTTTFHFAPSQRSIRTRSSDGPSE